MRLTAQTIYLRARAACSPWLPAATIAALEPAPMTAVMETWLLLDGAIITPTPAVTFLPLGVAEGWDRVQSIVPRDMIQRLRHASEWLVDHTLLVLGYVNLSTEYMVYAEPVRSPREQCLDRKSARRPVDRRLGMGRYLLIDPARSGAYGHPSGGQGAAGTKPTGGIRAAHGRRSPWRYLRHERFRRDPATNGVRRILIPNVWIGERTWQAEGQRGSAVAPAATVHVR